MKTPGNHFDLALEQLLLVFLFVNCILEDSMNIYSLSCITQISVVIVLCSNWIFLVKNLVKNLLNCFTACWTIQLNRKVTLKVILFFEKEDNIIAITKLWKEKFNKKWHNIVSLTRELDHELVTYYILKLLKKCLFYKLRFELTHEYIVHV